MIHLLLIIIYLAFISLGLPDSLLGTAWPNIYPEMNVPISFAGIITIIICSGTILSSLSSEYINKKLGTGKVIAISVTLTCLGLLGFYFSKLFFMLCLSAIPYGLGAGSIDSALNNYVALHYKSKHMSWLHCMWGIGATVGPYIMSYVLTKEQPWNDGYLYIAIIQMVLAFIMYMSLPLWKKSTEQEEKDNNIPIKFKEIISTKGVILLLVCFFCYSALEQTTMLWASSFFISNNEVSESLAASLASLFFIGMTLGRLLCGFISIKMTDKSLIRLGYVIIAIALICIFINQIDLINYIGMLLLGLGCAPIYPSIIHSTPINFGKEKSQGLIGLLMATSYFGVLITPPLFGLLAQLINASILPIYLTFFGIIMIITFEILHKILNSNIRYK